MTLRRNIIIGGLAASGLLGAEVMTPRKRLSLLGAAKLVDIAPMTFAGWSGKDVSDLIAPPSEDSLQSRLYGQMVERTYTNEATGESIMMLLAHGDTQSNDLQLHRPEVCYPAFGFTLKSSFPAALTMGAGATLPVREIVASLPDRQENVLYWSRLGEYLPRSGTEQRKVRFANALRGYVADGLLARFSNVGTDSAAKFAILSSFVGQFLLAMKPEARPAFVGSDLSRLIQIPQPR